GSAPVNEISPSAITFGVVLFEVKFTLNGVFDRKLANCTETRAGMLKAVNADATNGGVNITDPPVATPELFTFKCPPSSPALCALLIVAVTFELLRSRLVSGDTVEALMTTWPFNATACCPARLVSNITFDPCPRE